MWRVTPLWFGVDECSWSLIPQRMFGLGDAFSLALPRAGFKRFFALIMHQRLRTTGGAPVSDAAFVAVLSEWHRAGGRRSAEVSRCAPRVALAISPLATL